MRLACTRVAAGVVALLVTSGCSDGAARGVGATNAGAGGDLLTGSAGSGATSGSSSELTAGSANGGLAGSVGATAAGNSAGGAAGGGSGNAGSAGSGGNAGNGGNAGSGGDSALPACKQAHADGAATLTLTSGNRPRKVRLFVPRGYDGTTRLPLVLNLHGSSDNADNFAQSSQMEQVADAEGFLVAGLEAVAGSWNVPPAEGMPDDVTYASDSIALVARNVCVDTRRVYASGFSGGGRVSSRLGCELAAQIAAIGPVAGVRWPAPCPGRPLPVLAIHGLADTTNVYAGEGPEHPRWNESVEDAVLGWATRAGCNTTRQVDDPSGPLSSYTFGQCQAGVSVKLIRMDGVEHAYPTGTPLHAAREVWRFVKAFSLP